MASIATSIELYDKVSAPINNMISALQNMIGTYESVDRAMDNGFDTSKIFETRKAVDLAAAQMNELGAEIQKNQKHQENFNREVEEGEGSTRCVIIVAEGTVLKHRVEVYRAQL